MAYTYTANDGTNYDYADWIGSPFAYNSVSASTSNGQLKLYGGWIFMSLQSCKMQMDFEFMPSTTGRAHCSADISLSYKLIAGTAYGAFSYLYIRLVLLDSSRNPIESIQIWSDGAYCISAGDYFTTSGTPWISENVYWSYTLQQGTTYYAAVELYSMVYNGGWARSAADSVLVCDVSEISVYT